MLNLSFYITLFLLSLNQLLSISKSGGFNLYLFDLSMGIFALGGLFYFLLAKKSFKIPKYSFLFIIFSIYAVCTLILAFPGFSPEEVAVSTFYLVRWSIYLLGGIVVYNMIDKGFVTKYRVINAFFYSGVLISVLGFVQLIVLPDFTVLDSSLGWDPHKNRLASTFFDPNFVGAYLVLCLAVLLERFYPGNNKGNGEGVHRSGGRSVGLKKADLMMFFIILVGLFLTFSRSAWGMFAVVILFYGIFRSKALLITAFFIAFLAYFAIPRIQTRVSGITDPADSAAFRLISWSNTIKIIEDNFWTGVGFNTFRYAQQDYGFLTPDISETHSGAGSDSSLLFVTATTGILGLVVYLMALVFPIWDSLSRRKSSEWLILAAITFGFLLESQFINSLFYPQIMFFWFSLMFSYSLRT